MKTLTLENIELGIKITNEYGDWTVGQDENGWTVSGRSGSKMLFESQFQYYTVK